MLLSIASDRTPAEDMANDLRHQDPPVVARVVEDRLVVDLRTVMPEQDEALLKALLELK
jgi:L-seryl-tRNA(Ser) seleniumtransferase